MNEAFENKLIDVITLKNKELYYKLQIIFGLFFPLPAAAFLFFIIKYNVLRDESIHLILLTMLVFSLCGFSMLKSIFNKIVNLSNDVSENITTQITNVQFKREKDELYNLVKSFNAIVDQLKNTNNLLGKKISEISTLKELSDLCYVTFDTNELFYITLERALKLVNADVGSVLMLERPHRKTFVVQSTIGLGNKLTVGEEIEFNTSIAKYAVINKSPIVVEDIEKDTRFGRSNRPNYATKSFVCMPIKTIKDIIGVVTISRRDDKTPFTQEDIEVLTPLLSNAAFTYENLRLVKQNELDTEYFKVIEKILKNINSNFQDNNTINTFLSDVQALVPFDLAMILMKDENRPDNLVIFDLFAKEPTNFSKGDHYPYKGSIIDKVMEQGTTMIIDDLNTIGEFGKELFMNNHYKSCILNKLETGGNTKGALIFFAQEPEIFHKVKEFIEIVTDSISLAISKNTLSLSIKKRKTELDTLKQIGNILASSTFDIDQVLKYTMDMVRVVMNVEAGSLLLLHENELEFRVAFNIDMEIIRKLRLKLGQGIVGYAATCGKSIIVNNVMHSPHFPTEVDRITGFKTRSALCVPIISQGKVLGVIELLNKIYGDFSSNDEHLLQSIASSVSIAMDNARLYRETVSMTEHERGIRQMFQKFVPKEVVDKIIHGEQFGKTVIDELRTLTLLNIDIRGFSKLATKIGPQKTVSILNHFFSIMGGIVFNHHGIVDKYLGDGFLAIFGAPLPSQIDADNAIDAALEMKESIKTVSDYLINKISTPLVIGISVHTGEVVIGNIGFDKKIDYTVIGDPVNTVFRLQNLAKSVTNGILISEKTHRISQSNLIVREFGTYKIDSTLGDLKVFELLGIQR